MAEPVSGTWDPVWEQIFASRPWGRYPTEAVVRAVFQTVGRLRPREGVRVLDVGCGPGAVTWFLAREGFDAAAVDGSPTALRLARERLDREGLKADLREGDFTRGLPWPDDTFDAAIDSSALCTNPLAAFASSLAEMRRVLKPGGVAISMSFTDRTWGYGRGTPAADPGAFRDIDVGPLAGEGLVHFFGRADLDKVFAAFSEKTVERTSYTLGGDDKLVEWWVVVARK